MIAMRPPCPNVSIKKSNLGRRLLVPKHELIQIMSQTLNGKLAVVFAEVRSKCVVLERLINDNGKDRIGLHLHCQCVEAQEISESMH